MSPNVRAAAPMPTPAPTALTGPHAAFARWADGEARPSPPRPAVAAYLAARSEAGRSLSSGRPIRAAHLEAGDADPSASEGVRRVLRGLSRQRAGQGGRRQAAALTAEALAAIRATAAAPRAGPTGRTESPEAARIRGAVDVALASVMRDAMLRRSEAAALEWARCRAPAGWIGTAPMVRRSKTDQEGEGAVQYLGKGTAAALREIRPANPDPDARVFGLRSGRSVARRLAAMAGRRARRRVLRTLCPGRDGPASRGLRGLRRRPGPGRWKLRPDARPLRGRAGRTGGSPGE